MPERVLAEIANRIAHAFESAPGIPASRRADWITTDEAGHRIYYLPWGGEARSASLVPRSLQEEIRGVIDDLTRSDPLAFWAFDQPWNHDKGNQVTLPDGFAKYLGGPRPSGPGALRGVQVLDAYELARRRLIFLDFDEQGPIKSALRELAPVIENAQVLVCDYIPTDGRMNYSHARHFWYGEAPPNWSALAADLPDQLVLKRVGPPRTQAPHNLAEADRAVASRETR